MEEFLFVLMKGVTLNSATVRSNTMSINKTQKLLIIGGATLAAAGIFAALQFAPKSGSDAVQGAIGQRQVYRDNAVTSSDVAVTPGSAPVVGQTDAIKNGANDATSSAARQQVTANEAKATSEGKVTSEAKATSDAKATSEARAAQAASHKQ